MRVSRLLLWFLIYATPIWALPFGATLVFAQEAIVWDANTKDVDLAGKMSMLRDPSGLLTIDDVVQPERAQDFKPQDSILAQGFTRDVFWLKFDLTADHDDSLLLQVNLPYLEHVTLYAPTRYGGMTETTLGIRHPFVARPFPHRSLLFPLALPHGPSQTYYLQIESTSTMVVRAHLWSQSAFALFASQDSLVMGLMHGASLIMVLFALIQYLLSRDSTYGWLTLYIAMAELAFLSANGYLHFILPTSPIAVETIYRSSILLYIMVATLCGASVLKLYEWTPVTNRVLQIFIILVTCWSFVQWWGFDGWIIVSPVATTIIAVIDVLLIGLAAKRAIKGDSPAIAALIGFLIPVTIGAIIQFRNVLGLSIYPNTIDYAQQVGLIPFAVMLSLSVFMRTRRIESEKLEVQGALLALSASIEQNLSLQVNIRTQELTQTQKRLESALTAERQASQEQRDFLTMVSHEFRTPLAILGASTQVLELKVVDEDDVLDELVKIADATERMTTLVESYLTDEWLGATTAALHPIRFVIADFLTDLCHIYRRDFPDHTFVLDVFGRLEVEADPQLLEVAVGNLLSNAAKYAPSFSMITIEARRHGDDCRITVSDSGAGLPEDETERIFDRFYRSSNSIGKPGVGLGLHLVRRIAVLHGGSVKAFNRPEGGACFDFRIKAVPMV